MSQYAIKGVKSLCITSSQTVYVRKPDLVSCKIQERLGGWPICEIYLNTYFQRARLGGRLICEIGLYASIYGKYGIHPQHASLLHKRPGFNFEVQAQIQNRLNGIPQAAPFMPKLMVPNQ